MAIFINISNTYEAQQIDGQPSHTGIKPVNLTTANTALTNWKFVLTSKQKQNVSLTLASVLEQSLIDVMLSGVFQDVEETQVDSVRLFHDDVQQRLSGFDWTISQRLN